jgi:hypothetical protein
MRWAGHVARMGEKMKAYRILGKPGGTRPLGRPRRRWVDNIKMELREIGWDGMDWIDLAQDRDHWRALVNTVMNLRVPWNAGEFLSSCTSGSFSRRVQLHEWVSEWTMISPVFLWGDREIGIGTFYVLYLLPPLGSFTTSLLKNRNCATSTQFPAVNYVVCALHSFSFCLPLHFTTSHNLWRWSKE